MAKKSEQSAEMPMSPEMKSAITKAVNQIAAWEAAEKTLKEKKAKARELVRRSMVTHGQEVFATPKASAKLVSETKRSVTEATWRFVARLPVKMMAKVLTFKAAQAEKVKDAPGVAAVLKTLEEKDSTRLVIETEVGVKVTAETSADPNRARA